VNLNKTFEFLCGKKNLNTRGEISIFNDWKIKNRRYTRLTMKAPKLILVSILLISGQLLFGQQAKNPWEKWNWLIGKWVGEGNGQPGQGVGRFSFQTDLNGEILVRRSETVFPATEKTAETKHSDLLIIYTGSESKAQEAIYFDNEGHTIKYTVSFNGKSIVLTSPVIQDMPRFRFSYSSIDNKTVSMSFEMASPQKPEEFKIYLEGKASKVK
jgi:hypothetical protein